MKKVITLLAACMLVAGLAGFASAQCLTCTQDPGAIQRGCETSQSACYPFDYEDFSSCMENLPLASYCSNSKTGLHRLVFDTCECIVAGTWPDLISGDTVDVSMEILVDNGTGSAVTGDNGVYWAEDVNSTSNRMGLPLTTFPRNPSEYCDDSFCNHDEVPNMMDTAGTTVGLRGEQWFMGKFQYNKADGSLGTPYDGTTCSVATNNRVVKFITDTTWALQHPTQHGYTVTDADEAYKLCEWWIDIPMMRVDPGVATAGAKVYVNVCLYPASASGLCSLSGSCCCMVYIGQLCCSSIAPPNTYSCLYPYIVPLDSTYWDNSGIIITNLGNAGTATITLYEADGDKAVSAPISLNANEAKLINVSDLAAQMTLQAGSTGSGTLGDSKGYMNISCTSPINGLMVISSSSIGESISYLPICKQSGKTFIHKL